MNPTDSACRGWHSATVPTATHSPGAEANVAAQAFDHLRSAPARQLVGSSAALRSVLDDVARVAPTTAPVLILGETGTGKELLSQAIHASSNRAQRQLVRVDCSSLSASLTESELFGHLKGAFTGAVARRAGRIELAHRGTLFLDEIGELPLEHQAKLLRVLQEGEFEPLGTSETVRVDIRVIAATHRPLMELVTRGQFRADLYHRIAAFVVRVPPLRERREDIPALVSFLLDRQAAILGRAVGPLQPRVLQALVNHSWPGNVRELQNAVQRACIVASGRSFTVADFGIAVDGHDDVSDTPPAPLPAPRLLRTLKDVEREHICAVLRACGGVIEGQDGAARVLGLPPSTLRFRIRKLAIAPVTEARPCRPREHNTYWDSEGHPACSAG